MNKFAIENIIIEKSEKDIQTGILYEFSDGINLICGDNETGKSSLLAFIRQGFFKTKGVDTGKIRFKIQTVSNINHYRCDIKDNRSTDLRCKIFDENNNPLRVDFIENNVIRKYFEQGFTIDLDDLMSIQNKTTETLVNTIKDPSGEKLSILLEKIKNESKKILGDNNRLTKDTQNILEKINAENIKIKELSELENQYNNFVQRINEINDELEIIQKKEEFLGILEKLQDLNAKLNELKDKKNVLCINFNEKLFNHQEKYTKIIQNVGKIEANKAIIEKNSSKLEQLNTKISIELSRLRNEFSVEIQNTSDIEQFKIDYNILNNIKELLKNKNELEKELIIEKQKKENTEENLLRLKHENYPLNQKKLQEKQNKFLKIIDIVLMLINTVISFMCFYNNLWLTGVFSSIVVLLLLFIFLKIPNYTFINDVISKNLSDIDYNNDKLQTSTEKIIQIQSKIVDLKEKSNELMNSAENNIKIYADVYISAVNIIKNIKDNLSEINSLTRDIRELELENTKIINDFNNFISEIQLKIPLEENYLNSIQQLKSFNRQNTECKNSLEIINSQIEDLTQKMEVLNEKEPIFQDEFNNYISKEELIELKKEKINEKKETEFKKRELEKFEGLNNIKLKKAILLNEYRKKMFALAKNKMIIQIIKTAKEGFDKVQPDLQNAQKYLDILTEGKYTKINLDLEEIGNKDGGITKKWNELSRGTKEQLYLALKLGFASNYTKDKITMEPNGKADLPFIIDDAFVNFDTKRTRQGIQCLIELSKTNQILFFTCHTETMKRHFEELCSYMGINLNLINIQ